jgi:hypothetical protein
MDAAPRWWASATIRVMPGLTLTLRHINRATLARQMLLAREAAAPLAAIERLVGMQAQLPRPPYIGLWSRVSGFTRDSLTTLFEQRKVVRATFLRATLHLVTAKDYLALRPAIQPALDAALHGILRTRMAGMDLPELTTRARRILGERPRTFEELRDEFLRTDPKADERAMGYAVRLQLPLVQVPAGKSAPWAFPAKASFAVADEWLGRTVSTAPEPADELVLRYLAAYGPATGADIQAWSGLPTLGDTMARLAPRLTIYRDERKRELFDLRGAALPAADTPAPVRFIPDYDNLVVTRADERFVARVHRPKVFLPGLRVAPTVLIDGFVAATWKIERTRRAASLVVEPFAPLASRVRKDVIAEGEALLHFAEPDAQTFDVRVT